MRLAALTFALLLASAPLRAQDAAGTPQNKATAAEPATAAPTVPAETKPRQQLFLDLLEELVRPRPAPVDNAVAPAPAGTPAPAPVSTAPAPAPAGPADTPTAVSQPRADSPAALPLPVPATAPDPAPPPATVVEPPVRSEASRPAAAETNPRPVPEEPPAEPDRAFPSVGWALLGLAAAAALAASLARLRSMRRIARTRAALALKPRLDASAGAASLRGLALAAPPLAIRARLDWPGARNG